jgi:hypothetical protein
LFPNGFISGMVISGTKISHGDYFVNHRPSIQFRLNLGIKPAVCDLGLEKNSGSLPEIEWARFSGDLPAMAPLHFCRPWLRNQDKPPGPKINPRKPGILRN